MFSVSAATTMAYLTSTSQSLENILTPGNITVKISETDWEEKSGEAILPGECRKKNPKVQNTGTITAWIFLEADIPVRKIRLVDAQTRCKLPEADTELVQFTAKEGWKLMERITEPDKVRYVYGYQTPVEPLGETNELFEEITVVPYLEGELDPEEVLEIPVTARAVQAHIAPEGTDLKEIYQIYLDQKNTEEGEEQS